MGDTPLDPTAVFAEFVARVIGGIWASNSHSTAISASPGGILVDAGNDIWLASIPVGFRTNHGRFMSAQPEQAGWSLVGDRTQLLGWETFYMTQAAKGKVTLKTLHGRFVSGQPNGQVIGDRTVAKEWETWDLISLSNSLSLVGFDPTLVGFRSFHGKYLSAQPESGHWAIVADRTDLQGWETFTQVRPPEPVIQAVPNPWPHGIPPGTVAITFD